MKLATYKDGSRDGQLVVVSRDLASAHFATGIATRLQQVLDDWNFLSPQLEDLSAQLNGGKARHAFPFDPRLCLAPLPRLGLFAQAAVAAAGAPEVAPRAGGPVRGPVADAVLPGTATGLACEVSLAVVTGDVAAGIDSGPALESVRLLLMLADSRFDLDGGPTGQRIAPAFAPVAVTPDELGGAWQRGKATLAVSVQRNGRAWARLASGPGQKLHFGQLIARLAAAGPLGAGSVVASGPLALAEGSASPTALQAGDALRIEARGDDGPSAFGPIEQALRWHGPAPADDESGGAGLPPGGASTAPDQAAVAEQAGRPGDPAEPASDAADPADDRPDAAPGA